MTPRIVSFNSIKPNSRNISMIYFDKAQWKKLRSGFKVSRAAKLPKKGMMLEFIPNPDGGVIANPRCDSGPDNICMVVTRWAPNGVTMECRCRPKRGGNGGGGGIPQQPPKPKCRLLLGSGSVRCIPDPNEPCTTCELRIVEFGGRILLTCVCA